MIYRFGSCEIDALARELRVDGRVVETEPKAFALLVHLVENRERAVSKDELLAAIWPHQIVSETALTRAIMKARRALGDDSNRQSAIRTVHGHGYRFVAVLEAASGNDAAAIGVPDTSRTTERDRRLVFAGIGVVAFIAITALVVFTPWHAAERGVTSGSVAVLPVNSRLEDAEFDWVRLGLMSLLQRMLEEGGIDVVPDKAVLAAVGDDRLDKPPGIDKFDALRSRARADSLLHTTLDRQGGLHRLDAVVIYPDGRTSRRVIVGEAPAQLAADMAGVLSKLLADQDYRSGGRFARASTDPFVNEMYARALDLELQGKLKEARRLFQLAADQEPDLFWLRYEIALCTRDLREWDVAEALFQELYEEAAAGSDPRATIVTLNSHGIMQFNRNRYDDAEALMRNALDVAVAHGDPGDQATVLINLGLVATRRGDLESADAFYDRALDAYDEAGKEPTPSFLNNYAGLLLRRGDLERARAFSERAVEAFRVMGHRRFEAPSTNRLARILRRQGDNEGAIQRHEQARAIYVELGDEEGELSVMSALSTAYRSRGDLTRAALLARETLERARLIGNELLLANAHMQFAQVEADASRYDAAFENYDAALKLFVEIGDAAGLRAAEDGIANAAIALGQIDQARRIADDVLAAAIEAGRGRDIAHARLLAGQVAAAAGDLAGATAHYESALDYARQDQDFRLLPQAAIRLADLELQRGAQPAATALLDEARPHAADDRDVLRLDARLAIARDDRAAAMQIMERLRRLAGEAWTDGDELLLAVARGENE